MAYFTGVQTNDPSSLHLNDQRSILGFDISGKAGLITAPRNGPGQGHASSPILVGTPVLARQPTEGGVHGPAREVQLRGKAPRRRQPFAGGQPPIGYGFADALVAVTGDIAPVRSLGGAPLLSLARGFIETRAGSVA